jgi:hypothetical protein
MFGSIPPFFTSFPYGPNPSSSTSSTKFVDLFSTQANIQGNKTFVGLSTAGPAVTVTKTAQTGAAEIIARWNISDDATSLVQFENTSSADGLFAPRLRMTHSTTGANDINGRGTTDTGTVGVLTLTSTIGSGAVSVRPLLKVKNGSTDVVEVSAAGAMTIDGGSAPALTMGGRVNLKSYTVATLPSAATAGGIVYVSDAAVAPCLAFTNGTNWKRCDNAATTVT